MHNVDALHGNNNLQTSQNAAASRLTSRHVKDSASQQIDPASARTGDRVELSPSALDSSNRAAEVARVRAEISAGTYLTDDRINGAVRAVMDHLG